MINILTDLHHGDLYYSLYLLFEKRLKVNLFRPIGIEWFKKGFWKIAEPYGNAPDTINQYLGIPPIDKPAQKHAVERYGRSQLINDIYYIPCEITVGEYYIQKGITLNKFLEMDFDFVIATYHAHDQVYSKLVSKYKPNAIFIRQIGNINYKPESAKNVLLATNTPMPPDINYIKYHPEHHKNFSYIPPTKHNKIKSFFNCPTDDITNINYWNQYKEAIPEAIWKMHGIRGKDGVIPNRKMPVAMKDSAFIWHVKSTGSGGFVPRQAMACGRPVITRTSYAEKYKTLCRDIYEDSINCIDLDAGSKKENIEKIKYFMRPDNHIRLCESTAESFKQKVNFEVEAERIKRFLYEIQNNI